MANLLDLSPEEQKEKIKLIINEAIKKKSEQIQLLEKENNSLKNQEETGKYYMELSKDPKLSIGSLGGSIINILSDILIGFAEVGKQIKEDLEKKPQKGGGEEGEEEITQKLKNEADNLNSLIGQAEKELKKYQDVSSKSLGPGTVKSELNKGLDKAKNIGISLFKTGVKWSEEFINQMLELSMEASGEGKILDTPLDELSPELNKKLLLLAGVLKELSTNPATKEAVKEIAKATGTTLVEIMEEIKPELDKVTDEALVLIKNVADKSARGATSTGVSVAQAVLAEIPWVGGIIDFFLALGKGYNSLMEVVKTLSDKGGKLAVSNAKAVKGTEDSVKEGIERIQTAVESAKKILEEAQKGPSLPTTSDIKTPTTSTPTTSTPTTSDIKPSSTTVKEKTPESSSQGGGSKIDYIPNKQINKKIQKAGKRLRKTLKLFNKTLPKMNYSLKQNNKRRAKKSQKNKKKYTRKHIV